MAVEKGKVKAALDAKFKGKSVSKELKEAYAARWAEKIENEEGIEEFINDREDDVLDAAREADRRATTASAKARQEAADAAAGKKPDGEEKGNDKPIELPDDTPGWAKALIEQNKSLAERVNAFDAQQKTKTIKELFEGHEKIKAIPKELLVGRYPTSEAELEAAVESTTTQLKPYLDVLATSGYGNDRPGGAAPKGGASKADPVTDAAIKSFAAQKVEEFKTSQQN